MRPRKVSPNLLTTREGGTKNSTKETVTISVAPGRVRDEKGKDANHLLPGSQRPRKQEMVHLFLLIWDSQ